MITRKSLYKKTKYVSPMPNFFEWTERYLVPYIYFVWSQIDPLWIKLTNTYPYKNWLHTPVAESKERRNYTRKKTLENTFVLLWSDSMELGQIVDISLRGLSFSYFAGKGRLGDVARLDIGLSNGGFYLGSIPVKTVSDIELAKSPSIPIAIRRRGVQFKRLTEDQSSQLQQFLRSYASD